MMSLFSFACVLNAQTEKWEYPIKPGSQEWRMTSYAYKVEKSQPPKEILNKWDTGTLFEYCMNYPFNLVTWMYNDPNFGFKHVYEQSSVWQEFVRRKDAVDVLVKYFETFSFERLYEIEEAYIRGIEAHKLYFLEKVVSKTDFTAYLDVAGKRKLANTILQTHLSKQNFPDRIYGYRYNSSLCALIKILESDLSNGELSLTKLRETTRDEYFVDAGMDEAIITKVFNYINR